MQKVQMFLLVIFFLEENCILYNHGTDSHQIQIGTCDLEIPSWCGWLQSHADRCVGECTHLCLFCYLILTTLFLIII